MLLRFGHPERNLVSELREAHNKWAPQKSFSGNDTYRALDSAARFLTAVSASQTNEIEKMKTELLRLRFDEQVRSERRKSAFTAIESATAGNLKPWREVVTPQEDVASRRYQQAEAFFLDGMTHAMHRLAEQAHHGFPVNVYYAFKQAESEGADGTTASAGWDNFLDAVIQAGSAITGTWR